MKNQCQVGIFWMVLGLLWGATNACTQPSEQDKQANTLIHETSPYLLQHAYNPVQWHPWNTATLAKAQRENKPLIISIGYAACHWCHVMEEESFEDPAVAQLMDEHFVCIKVDREERPDVDQVYMTACQLINKSGGWPLNAFALPTGEPFYAGTYFTKENWIKILQHFIDKKNKNHQELEQAAQQLTQGIVQMHQVPAASGQESYSIEQLHQLFQAQQADIDWKRGGFLRGQYKFPLPSTWRYLLRYGSQANSPKALEAVHTTLEQMAQGGIYDQLGGGFARYSTDGDWKVPHFEKMLYDNAQLVRLYAEAYQQSKNPRYRALIEQTLTWIERDLTAPTGGFYASLDADSKLKAEEEEKEEGAYYTWTKQEVEQVLGQDAPVFLDYYKITARGNWEKGQNILLPTMDAPAPANLETLKQQLLQARQQRPRPALDNKRVTAWNALQITAYVKAYRALGKEAYLETALQQMELILAQAWPEQKGVWRTFSADKTPTIAGFLDDYAFLIEACLELYQVTFEERWIERAEQLTKYVYLNFKETDSALFLYTPASNAPLVAAKREVHDNVIPSSNSQMALNLYHLGIYLNDKTYQERALAMLQQVRQHHFKNPAYFANWGLLALETTLPFYEVAIVGEEAVSKRQAFDQHYLPQALWLGGTEEGQLELLQHKLIPNTTTIYVCQKRVCQRPVEVVEEALKLLD